MSQATGTATTGSGKYEQLLVRCKSLQPVPTAVAHPCEVTALSGAVEAANKGLIIPILVGPRDKDRSNRQGGRDRSQTTSKSSTFRTATQRRRRRSNWCARPRPNC